MTQLSPLYISLQRQQPQNFFPTAKITSSHSNHFGKLNDERTNVLKESCTLLTLTLTRVNFLETFGFLFYWHIDRVRNLRQERS